MHLPLALAGRLSITMPGIPSCALIMNPIFIRVNPMATRSHDKLRVHLMVIDLGRVAPDPDHHRRHWPQSIWYTGQL